MQVYSIPINSDQREITHHGTSEFPIAVYETDLEKNVLGYVPWHWHEEIQFCYVVGERVCFHINHQKVVLEKDQGISCTWQRRQTERAEFMCAWMWIPRC